MSETADEVRRIAIYAADEYRATTGDNAFNLTFDGTMELLSIAIRCERDRCAKIAEAQSVIHMSDAGLLSRCRGGNGNWPSNLSEISNRTTPPWQSLTQRCPSPPPSANPTPLPIRNRHERHQHDLRRHVGFCRVVRAARGRKPWLCFSGATDLHAWLLPVGAPQRQQEAQKGAGDIPRQRARREPEGSI